MSDRSSGDNRPLRQALPDPSTAFAVVDLETGGLDPAHDPILQMAIVGGVSTVDPVGFRVTDEWCTMVRLERPWRRYGARHIHGIRRHRLLLAPSLSAAMERFAEVCGERTIVAHNLAFDWSFIDAAAGRTGVALPGGPHLCTLELSRSLDPARALSHRLGDIAARLGITHDNAHDALGDARTTAHALPHLLAQRRLADADATHAR